MKWKSCWTTVSVNKIQIPFVRRVWRYQRVNQNPYIEEEQTTQWLKEKGQKDKQRSTNHTCKITDRVTRTPIKPRVSIIVPYVKVSPWTIFYREHFELEDTIKCYTCSTSDTCTSDKTRVNWTSFLRGNGSVYHNRKLSTGKYVIDNINNKYPLMHVHNRGEFICSRKISNSCYTRGTRRVTQVTNPVINHEWG